MSKSGKRLGFLPDWRIFTYVILIINILFLIWIIAGANSGSSSNCNGLDAKTCKDAKDVGTAIGVGLIIGLWAFVDIILGILWLITNRKKRDCPVCGHSVKKGVMQCRNCGHDFRQQHAPQGYNQGYQPQGYPQQFAQGHPQQGYPQQPPPTQQPPRPRP